MNKSGNGRKEPFLIHLPYLEELIRIKEEKLALYMKNRLNEIWLLIIARGFSNPDPFNIHNQLEKWHIQSRFDRVIMIDLNQNRLYTVYEKQA